MENSERGYSTHVLGAIKPVSESLSVILYNRFRVPDELKKPSLYNLKDIVKYLKESDEVNLYVNLVRDNTSEDFIYKYKSLGGSGFNVLIYLDSLGSPSGYTEFKITQGEINNIDLELDFDIKAGIFVGIDIKNSLIPVLNEKDEGLKIEEDNLASYTTSTKRIYDRVSKLQKRNYYSEDVASVYYGDKVPLYVPGVNLVKSSDLVYGQGIGIDLGINPYSYLGYTKCNLGFYNSKLSIYLFDGSDEDSLRYNIFSVGQDTLNIFSSPVMYNNDVGIEGFSVVDIPVSLKIKYGSSGYLVFSNEVTGGTRIYNTRTGTWIEEFEDGAFIDPYDSYGRIRESKKYTDIPGLLRDFPELVNLNFPPGFNKYYSYQILSIIGNWVLFKSYIYSGSESITYYYSSPEMTLIIDPSEIPLCLPISDSSILVKSTEGNYYTLYTSWRTLEKTELKYARDNDLEMTYYSGLGIYMPGDFKYILERSKLYLSGYIGVIDKSKPIWNTPLNYYRKGLVPRDSEGNILEGIPDLIGSYGGFIFYLDELKTRLSYV